MSLALGQVGPAPQGALPISISDIEAARTLLAQAQAQLEPQQYELLERGLVEAEAAFQRYSALVKASGEVAEVARGAEALAGAQRASRIAEGLGSVSRVGPLLVAIAVLWPRTSIATQGQELPPRQVAQRDLQAALQRVATDSQRVGEEIEAARKSQDARGAAMGTGAASRKSGSGQPPDDPPCDHIETTGKGAFGPPGSPPGIMWCTYKCGARRSTIAGIGSHRRGLRAARAV